jgi:hypothetical protein
VNPSQSCHRLLKPNEELAPVGGAPITRIMSTSTPDSYSEATRPQPPTAGGSAGQPVASDSYFEWLSAQHDQARLEYSAYPSALTEHILKRARDDLKRAQRSRTAAENEGRFPCEASSF